MKISSFFTTAFLIAGLLACTTDKKVDSDAIKKELSSREIIHATEAEIIQKAHEIGNSIAGSSQLALGKKLQGALAAGGVENAISYCNLQALPLVDSLSKLYNAGIRRVSTKYRNPADAPTPLEFQILDAYEKQKTDSMQLSTNVQPIENDLYLFTKPIIIDNPLCLTCHGTKDNGMALTTTEFIKTKYPGDKATGYNMGDLRGMWSITLPKKTIVQTFSPE